ncbi:MAG: hypothetical protein CMJ89_14250 [Planctomycetes bacterium]|nr:hypothetical protein [Planctomycetota bacterium]
MKIVSKDVVQALDRRHAETRLRAAWTLAILLAVFACSYLGRLVYATHWLMDADEAVHAVEALRLYDHLAQGDIGAFFHDTYFPERWHPPVQPHMRWYPLVHAWIVQPFFLALGVSDFSARLPSIVLLFGTVLLFFEIARRLAPETPAASGLLAAFFLLSAPNVLTFSGQSLIATTALFFAYLALLAYLWSLEKGHPAERTWIAGCALGLAILTKYDHGGFLALTLGLCELGRARFSIPRFFRSGALPLFATALVMVVAWFAHPEKFLALGDSVRHPLPASLSRAARDTGATFLVEYSSSLAVGLGGMIAFLSLARRLREPGLRAVWVWALCASIFYVLRGRFYFRYNIVEAPVFLLFFAIQLPRWWGRAAAWLEHAASPTDLRRSAYGWGLSAALLAVGLACCVRPQVPLDFFSGTPFSVSEKYLDLFRYIGGSLVALSLAVFGVFVARLTLPRGCTEIRAKTLLAGACALAIVPGAAALYFRLDEAVDWELEAHPELADLYAFCAEHLDPPDEVLLAGGGDQLSNNSLRWYLLGRPEELLPFESVHVRGDMIGSIVFQPRWRVEYWAGRLAFEPLARLPRFIVSVTPTEAFLYRTGMGNENAIYGAVLDQRAAYTGIARAEFPTLGCHVEILSRDGSTPPLNTLPELEQYRRDWVSPHGWYFLDSALRHFVDDRRDERFVAR